ncbi:MAG TPA: Rieske 2Fe-2S domain-containing protein [Solirubrobacterales bacterium]|nr:Rieske 2Fe-2S domain-containing protein [Solirubrobacterales bacterium]
MSEEHRNGVPSGEDVLRALRRCWQPVARVQDLAQGPRRAVLLGEALAVFLTEGGAPAVVSDRCAHRGASLSMGAVVGDGIQCPYHGWEWQGDDGACSRIPSLADQRQIPPRARIPAYPARELWGLVWTVLEQPLGEPPLPGWFNPERWRCGHGTPFEVPVGLGVTIENFRDVSHFAFVHKATLGTVGEVVEPLQVERDGVEVTMRREMRTADGDGSWASLREGFNHVIAPNFTSIRMRMVKGERCLLHAARAIGATESAHYWMEGLSEDYDELTMEEAIASEERLYAEDREVMAAVEPRELPLALDADFNTLADRFTLAYREAFAEFVRRALVAGAGRLSSTAS